MAEEDRQPLEHRDLEQQEPEPDRREVAVEGKHPGVCGSLRRDQQRDDDAADGEREDREQQQAEHEDWAQGVGAPERPAAQERLEIGHLEEERPVVGRRRDVLRERRHRGGGAFGRDEPGKQPVERPLRGQDRREAEPLGDPVERRDVRGLRRARG